LHSTTALSLQDVAPATQTSSTQAPLLQYWGLPQSPAALHPTQYPSAVLQTRASALQSWSEVQVGTHWLAQQAPSAQSAAVSHSTQ
jgi:hypothetical protein